MATYQQIKKGSKGDSVSELQKLLNQNGYSLDADGIFGEKTQAAVRDYQSKNGLAVDGIVGSNTWSSLTNGANKQTQQNVSGETGKSTADWLADYEKPIPTYTPSQAVQDAADRLAQYEQNKPGEYQSTYADQIQELLNQALNPQKFSYDPNVDPLYKQAAERYQQQGQLAMRDTMGQAAALSGGLKPIIYLAKQSGTKLCGQHITREFYCISAFDTVSHFINLHLSNIASYTNYFTL